MPLQHALDMRDVRFIFVPPFPLNLNGVGAPQAPAKPRQALAQLPPTPPLDDRVDTNCLLTVKLVSVAPLFAVVFSVLTVVFGNLNIEISATGCCF